MECVNFLSFWIAALDLALFSSFIWLHSCLNFLVSAIVLCCSSVCMSVLFFRTVFNVGPDTHIDNLEASEQVVLDGTSKWSCKIAVNGK